MQNNEFTLNGRYRYFKSDKDLLRKTIDFGEIHFIVKQINVGFCDFSTITHPKNKVQFTNPYGYWEEISLQEYENTLKLWLKDLEKDLLNNG